MAAPNPSERAHRITLVALTIAISILFLWMIREFLIALLLAAILSGMFQPVYGWFVGRFRGRRGLASAMTLLLVLLLIVGPFTAFLGVVANQALRLSQVARPWVEHNLGHAPELNRLFETVPGLRALEPYREALLPKLGELASAVGSFAVSVATAAARETVTFLLLLFVSLYAMFFFLINGKETLDKILYYLPLPPADEARMIEKFVSVSRATIKGTLVIGLIQGLLGGLGFFTAGLDGAALWGTVMAILSAVPGLGHALVWLPAVAYLAALGEVGTSLGLFAWCALVVGSVDNFLRPWLVGKDTQMSDLLILLSTLGGLLVFGALGFIIGPIVAALFVTVWDLYGLAFKDFLPRSVRPVRSEPALLAPDEETRPRE